MEDDTQEAIPATCNFAEKKISSDRCMGCGRVQGVSCMHTWSFEFLIDLAEQQWEERTGAFMKGKRDLKTGHTLQSYNGSENVCQLSGTDARALRSLLTKVRSCITTGFLFDYFIRNTFVLEQLCFPYESQLGYTSAVLPLRYYFSSALKAQEASRQTIKSSKKQQQQQQ